MCRKHKNHKRKDCPDNPRNKKKNSEVSSTEKPVTLTKDEAPGEEEVFSLLQGGLERNRV
jgi:hypothetical protein